MPILIKQRNKLFPLKVPRTLKIAYIWHKGLSVLANKKFPKGKIVIHFKADTVPNSKASQEAVQIDNQHSFDTKWLAVESFLNHNCDANTRLDIKTKSYVAIKNINKNEEITFNYNTTEWDSGDSFDCHCGSKKCFGKIRGLKYLPPSEQNRLQPYLLPFLAKRLARR